MKLKYTDHKTTINKTDNVVLFTRWDRPDGSAFFWQSGYVVTKYGLLVACRGSYSSIPYATFITTYRNKLFTRTFRSGFNSRQFSIYANRFAKDVLDGRVK